MECLALAGAAVLTAVGAGPVAGQDEPTARFHAVVDGGVSLHDSGAGLRLGRDMVTYGLRVTARPGGTLHPWVDAARFSRPDFDCLPGLACNDAGWLARAGIHVPLSSDPGDSGVHAAARAGVGAALSDETSLSYVVGFSVLWRHVPWLAPVFEVRREHLARINHTLLAAGFRIDF